MEYGILFSLMGTWIVWLLYRNYKLSQRFMFIAMMLDKVINKEVEVVKKEDGYDIIVKKLSV